MNSEIFINHNLVIGGTRIRFFGGISEQKLTMEVIFRRFPLASGKILKNLDDQSLTRSKIASRGITNLLENEKIFWIRIIKKYKGNFKGFEESWQQVINKISIDLVKQLARAVQEYFKLYNCELAPHQIAIEKGNFELCEYVFRKCTNKNPAGKYGWTPLHSAATNGHLEVSRLIIENVEDKNPANNDGDTPLHMAACDGHLDICRLILQNVENKILPTI